MKGYEYIRKVLYIMLGSNTLYIWSEQFAL